MKRNQGRSRKEQKNKPPAQRRATRQKLIQRIVQILGFPSFGFGLVDTINHLKAGEVSQAILAGIFTIAVILIAIAARFISELFNSVLGKVEKKLEDKTEPIATWIAG